MKVLVDTPIWSLAFRRRKRHLNPRERELDGELIALIQKGRAVLIGVVRQEVLSGIRDADTFERLRQRLAAFDDETLTREDCEEAAACYNRCRAAGVTGSPIDYLICAVALRRGLGIFTTDRDFESYAKHLPLHLHQARRVADQS